jgi:predicted unusual protein kinase regulating ubiquinone biosynthesis (AarF/ABC1/UbiB family)
MWAPMPEESGSVHEVTQENTPPRPAEQPVNDPAERSRPAQPDESHRVYTLRRGRFRRTVAFFVLLFIRIIAWEVIIRRLAGERFVARGRSRRWRHYARRFRALAISMGGVMIKMGQFVSSRVDVLPPEITDELAGLQDQVPLVDFNYIKATIESELGPLEENYLWVNPEPIAAASLGQVHRAQLHNGDRVVVKVQRPHITDIVQTDLKALGVVARLAMRFGPIRRRADVPALLDEFSRVLWEELDYRKEADNALTFSSMFADDPGIYIPAVYLQHTTHCVLTLEDVTSIKINDYAAIEQAGIDRKEVARRLLNCYLHQIFDQHFFHADPHPGNLFVYPLPEKSPNGSKPTHKGRDFYLIFVDFGMTGRLTPQIAQGLRETLIAVITQDAEAMVACYQKLGVLMPGTDTARLEAATRAVFEKVWGLNMTEITSMPFDEVTSVAMEFSDLLLSMPFQMPQDFIYLSRTVSILSGMCTGLDPLFDPWHEMQPFTEKLLSQNGKPNGNLLVRLRNGTAGVFAGAAIQTIRNSLSRAYRLPELANTVLNRAEKGELEVMVAPNAPLQKQITHMEAVLNQLAVGLVFATVAMISTLFFLSGDRGIGTAGYVVSALLLLMMALRGR